MVPNSTSLCHEAAMRVQQAVDGSNGVLSAMHDRWWNVSPLRRCPDDVMHAV